MINLKNINRGLVLAATVLVLASCSQPGTNDPGSEYMPDMAHGVAFESNYYDYYYYNTWGGEDEYYKFTQPRLPVKGSVPRSAGGSGALSLSNKGLQSHGGRSIPSVGSVPYYYADTEEDRLAATNELIDNPFEITDKGLAKGKELYDVFCATCHGEKGDGAGYLVRDDGGKYPAQPANFLLEEHLNASNGRYYHAIMHGKNLMGAYKDKMNYEERWQVIHYIRSLQAKELKKTYNQYENTLNDIDTPAGDIVDATPMMPAGMMSADMNHKSEEDHSGHDHDGHGHDDHDGHDHEGHQNDGHDHDSHEDGGH